MNAITSHRLAFALLLAALLNACHPSGVRPTPSPIAPAVAADVSGATRYQVDGAASDVHILVYRGGAMARLGHNHVVSSKNASGVLWLHKDLAHSRIEVKLPVAGLAVDDPQVRATEGGDFAAEVPRDAREGTRRNLLRAEVLDGERYPDISLYSTTISGARARPELSLRVKIRGVERDVVTSAVVREDGERLTASGEFTIKQSDFGITPFSVGLGALQVLDQLRIKFSIVCVKQ